MSAQIRNIVVSFVLIPQIKKMRPNLRKNACFFVAKGRNLDENMVFAKVTGTS